MAPVTEGKVNLGVWGWRYFYLRLYVIIIYEPHTFSSFQWHKLKELSQEINNVLYCTTFMTVLGILYVMMISTQVLRSSLKSLTNSATIFRKSKAPPESCI